MKSNSVPSEQVVEKYLAAVEEQLSGGSPPQLSSLQAGQVIVVRRDRRWRQIIMLSLPVLGGALGSPGRAGSCPHLMFAGREGQVGRVGPELWLQVVAVVVLTVVVAVVVVRTTVELNRSSGEPGRRVVGWSGLFPDELRGI